MGKPGVAVGAHFPPVSHSPWEKQLFKRQGSLWTRVSEIPIQAGLVLLCAGSLWLG